MTRPRGRPPGKKEASPETKALAVEAYRQGATTREIARELGVSHVAVSKWVKAAEPPPLAPAPAPVEPDAPPDAPPPQPADLADGLAVARWMRASALYDAAQARRAGHHEAAASSMRQATTLVPVIARLEKAANVDGDGVRYTRAEIDKAIAGMRERFAALLARPLLCADCSRKLSISWGGVAIDADRGHEDHSEKPADPRTV